MTPPTGTDRRRHAVFVATRDPTARADHGRMRVLGTALAALVRAFDHVDLIVARAGMVPATTTWPTVTHHTVAARRASERTRGAIGGAVTGRGSLNAALGLGPHQVETIAAIGDGADFWLIDGVRSLPALAAAGTAPTFVDLDDLLSDRYRQWATLPFDELPFDIFGTRPSSPVNRLARLGRHGLPAALRYEAARVTHLEADAARRATAVSLVSGHEAARLAHRTGISPWVLPMGVVVARFEERPRGDAEFDAVFLGHVTHLPNLAGLHFVGRDLVPELRRRLGRVPRIAVVGAVTDSVRNWLTRIGLTPLGYVDDLASVFARSAVGLAPQVVGGGVNTKVLDYLRLGLPAVGTPAAFAGLVPSEDPPWFATDDAGELADAIVAVVRSPDRRYQARAGWEYVRDHYCSQLVEQRWVDAIDATADGVARPRPSVPTSPGGTS